MGDWMVERGITGTAKENIPALLKRFEESKAQADIGLAEIKKTYKTSEVPEDFQIMMSDMKDFFTTTRNKPEIKRLNEYQSKLDNGQLSHTDINTVKRMYERNVKLNYIKDQNSTQVTRANNIDTEVRNWQMDEAGKYGFDNLRQINRETQASRMLADAIGKKLAKKA